jgi:hypothetical protein
MLEASEKDLAQFLGEKSVPGVPGTPTNPEVVPTSPARIINQGLNDIDQGTASVERILGTAERIVNKIMDGIITSKMSAPSNGTYQEKAPGQKILTPPQQLTNAPYEKVYDAMIGALEKVISNKADATVRELLLELKDSKDGTIKLISDVINHAKNR